MKRYIKDGQIKTRNQIVIKGQRTINDKVINTNTFNPWMTWIRRPQAGF